MKKREEWEKLLEEQRGSGMSVARFCRERGISDSSFSYWRNKVREEARAGTFARVERGDMLRVELPGGKAIRVSRSDLAAVLGALCEG